MVVPLIFTHTSLPTFNKLYGCSRKTVKYSGNPKHNSVSLYWVIVSQIWATYNKLEPYNRNCAMWELTVIIIVPHY